MGVNAEWIAVDWGTSRLRVWAMAGDTVLAGAESDRGMSVLSADDFEPALLDLIGGWLGDAPVDVMACGMVGARQGWVEAGYAAVPTAPVSAPPVRVPGTDARLRAYVVPGLKQADPPDVMRGEETQIAGYLADTGRRDGVLCLPGTHTKWVEVTDGRVTRFQTFMTGELFGLLCTGSVLRHSVETGGSDGQGWDNAAFLAGVSDALAAPEALTAQLFALRARNLLEACPGDRTVGRLSGLLIGAELNAARRYWSGRNVTVAGAAALSEHYCSALAHLGVSAETVDAGRLVRIGLSAARMRLEEVA